MTEEIQDPIEARKKTVIRPKQSRNSSPTKGTNPQIKKDPELAQKEVKSWRMPFGWVLFSQFNHLFEKGALGTLTEENMNPLPEPARSAILNKKVYEFEIGQLSKPNGGKVKKLEDIIIPFIKDKLKWAIILGTITSILILTISLIPKYFIKEIKKSSEDQNLFFVWGTPVVVCILSYSRYVLSEHVAAYINQSGSMAGQILRGLIFRKLQKANIYFLQEADASLITKLLLFNFSIVISYISNTPKLYSFPIALFATIFFIGYNIGLTATSVLGIYLLTTMILFCQTKRIVKEELETEKYSSQRALLVFEVLSKAKHIKSNSFESYFKKKIEETRKHETAHLHRAEKFESISNFLISISGILSLLLVIYIQTNILENVLDVTTTFTIVAMISSIQAPMREFRGILMMYFRNSFAISTLNYFLFEVEDKSSEHMICDESLKAGCMEVRNVTAEGITEEWVEEELTDMFNPYSATADDNARLKRYEKLIENASFSIKKGDKICIVGSSEIETDALLYSLLGENKITRGEIKYRGKMLFSDADEGTFLIGKTLRDNILMGEDMIIQRYTKVLDVVGLNIDSFQGKDMCEVIEGGLNFSSSQRRKIVLARILYVAGDFYFMKDFFGYGEIVADELMYKRVVKGFLWDKTVMITTNIAQLLKLADKIIFVKNGNVKMFSKFEEFLKESNGIKLIKSKDDDEHHGSLYENNNTIKHFQSIIEHVIKGNRELRKKGKNNLAKNMQRNITGGEMEESTKRQEMTIQDYMNNKLKDEGQLIEEWDESQVFENLSKLLYQYFVSLGVCRSIFLLVIFMISVGLFIGIDLWTGIWSTKTLSLTPYTYMILYVCISLSASLFSVFKDIYFSSYMIANSNYAHKRSLDTFLNLPLRWLNKYPTAEIDYKMTYDMRTIDTKLSNEFLVFFDSLAYFVGGMIILNIVYVGVMLFVTVILCYFAYRNIKKLMATTRTFIILIEKYASLNQEAYNEAVAESYKYRMLAKPNILQEKFEHASDNMQRAMTHFGFFSNRWMGVRMGAIHTALIVVGYLLPVFFLILLKDYITLSTFAIAIAHTWSLKIVNYLSAFITSTINLHSEVVSYGRLRHFYHNADSEIKDKHNITNEEVKYCDYICDIRDVDLSLGRRKVLSNINLQIERSKKIAVVGESGEGKHLLLDLLLHIHHRDDNKGVLKMFAREYSECNAMSVRKNVHLLSEFPILFSGTFRSNVDPEGKFNDDEIIWCINKLELIDQPPNNLQTLETDPNSVRADTKFGVLESLGEERVLITLAEQEEESTSTHLSTLRGIGNLSHEKLLKLLDTPVGAKIGKVLIRIRRMLKIVKLLLDKPALAILDQKSLDLETVSNSRMLQTLTDLLPETTFIVVVATFNNILDFDYGYLIKGGTIVQRGSMRQMLTDTASHLAAVIKRQDMNVFKASYARVTTFPSDNEIDETESLTKDMLRFKKEIFYDDSEPDRINHGEFELTQTNGMDVKKSKGY